MPGRMAWCRNNSHPAISKHVVLSVEQFPRHISEALVYSRIKEWHGYAVREGRVKLSLLDKERCALYLTCHSDMVEMHVRESHVVKSVDSVANGGELVSERLIQS